MRLIGIPIPELPPRRSSRSEVEDDSSSSSDISTTESEGTMVDDDGSSFGDSDVGEGHTVDQPDPAPMTKIEEPVLSKPVQEQVENKASPSVASGSEGGVPREVDHAVVSPRLFPSLLITFPNL